MAKMPGKGTKASVGQMSFYQEFLLEREELLRHKWCMSERCGRDVGFEAALSDWAEHHRAEWRRHRLAARASGG